MKIVTLWFRHSITIFFTFVIIGCATALAPAPSPKLLTDSQSALTEGLVLMQGMSGGVEAGTYEQRKDSYSKLLANLQSIVVLIESRPPASDLDSDKVKIFLDYASSKGILITQEDLEQPNLKAAQNAVDQISFLRDMDKEKDCGKSIKCPTDSNIKIAIKGYMISMGAVIYYEQLLVDLKEDN
ncbi:MAG: hypothetical protein V7782_11040 [Psychromonas sp.]